MRDNFYVLVVLLYNELVVDLLELKGGDIGVNVGDDILSSPLYCRNSSGSQRSSDYRAI